MKREFMKISPPYIGNYQDREEPITLYSYYESILDRCRYCGDEDCDGHCEDEPDAEESNESKNSVKSYITGRPITEVSLQDLLNILPEGIKPKDVKISINIDTHDMGCDGHSVTFFYKKKMPGDPEGYKRDKAIWETAYAEWLEKDKKYQIWVQEQAIKELEAKISQLKK